MEKRGSGLRRIINETKALDGYKDELKPVFKSTTSQFMTTIYSTQYKRSELNGPVNGPVKDPVYGPVKGLSESLKQLYIVVCENQGLNTKQIAELLGRPVTTVKKQLTTLRKKALIEHRDSDKTGGYYKIRND